MNIARRVYNQGLKLRKQVLTYGSGLLLPRHQRAKFIILAQGRTGSSLLKDVLNSHPAIHCDDEVLNPAYNFGNGSVFFPALFLEGLSKKHPEKIYGCKIKLKHLKQQNQIGNEKAFLLAFLEKGWKVVYLYRENVLHHALSNIVAEERGSYHLRKGENNTLSTLRIDIHRLEAGMKSRRLQREEEIFFLQGLSYLELNYEKDLLIDPQIGADKVFNFLGLSSVQVTTNLIKVVNKDLSTFLDNYDLVEKHFQGSEFEKYLE